MSGKYRSTRENKGGNEVVMEPIDWDERLRAAVEATLRKRAAKRAERAEFKRRRDYGLVQRYALKTARIRIAKRREE